MDQRGAYSSLILSGYAIAAAVCTSHAALPAGDARVAIGIGILVAAVISLPLRNFANYYFEIALRRYFSILFMVGILAAPFAPGLLQRAFCILLVAVSTCFFVLIIDAVIETARTQHTSVIWLFSREGAIAAIGLFASMSLFLACRIAFADSASALIFSCLTSSVIVSALQAFLRSRHFIVLEGSDAGISDNQDDPDSSSQPAPPAVLEATHIEKASWHSKIEQLSSTFMLSDRETEIIDLYARGRSMKAISEIMFLSISTVKTHIYHAYKKTDVHSRQELLNLIEQLDE